MLLHKDLDVYKKSVEMVVEVYGLTAKFPKEEMFGLVSQIRRSATSVPSNIAEGSARNSAKDYVRFLYIALGSAAELETQLLIASRLNFIQQADYEIFSQKINTISKMLQGLIRHNKKKSYPKK